MEFTIPLNKFEKHDLVIKLHKEGKTYREICHNARISPRDIKPILKKYERKKRLETKKEENNQPEKPSITSQVFKMLQEGHNITDIVIELNLTAKRTIKLWSQFLKLKRMDECYEFYQEFEHEIPSLLSIANFMKRNNVSIQDIANVLRIAGDTAQLYKTNSNLKSEIARMRQMKNDFQKTMENHQLPPLEPLPRYYNIKL